MFHLLATHPKCNLNVRKMIMVAVCPARLITTRDLRCQSFPMTNLEAKSRLGGGLYTNHWSPSVLVDLGASIITGVEADADTKSNLDFFSLIRSQLNLELIMLNEDSLSLSRSRSTISS